MERVSQRVAVSNVEFIIIHIMQKHIDTAKVVGRDVDFLPEKALSHVFFTEYLCEVKQK